MLRALSIISLLAGTAAADPPASTRPAATCKHVMVNHHITCQIDQPIVVSVAPPKPAVVIVHRDGKNVTGRPKSDDRLAGIPHRLD